MALGRFCAPLKAGPCRWRPVATIGRVSAYGRTNTDYQRFRGLLAGWVGLPLLVVIVIVLAAHVLDLDTDPNLPHITGTFRFGAQNCNSNVRGTTCHWYGDFTSGDGSVVRTDMTWAGSGDGQFDGRVVPAVYVGESDEIYPPPGPNPGQAWQPISWIVLACAAGLCWLWWFPVRGVRRLVRRSSKAEPVPPKPGREPRPRRTPRSRANRRGPRRRNRVRTGRSTN